jgi:hypothetical protein
MSDTSSSFMSGIKDFVGRVRTGECQVMNLLHEKHVPLEKQEEAKKEVLGQAVTFVVDVQKVVDGKMSYSDMRSLYG